MMESATLPQTPKSGRSRWSKALPAPPSLTARGSSLPQPQSFLPTSTRKQLPSAPVAAPLPPAKEKEKESSGMATGKPLPSPLPSLPAIKTGGPMSMAIPRRPVASPGSAPSPVSPPAVSSIPVVLVPGLGGRDPLSPDLSPVHSISDLLSAYSYRSSDSTPSTNSTNDTASSKVSETIDSPKQEGASGGVQAGKFSSLPSLADQNAQKQEWDGMYKPEGSDRELPPPPPPVKDPQELQRPQTPTAVKSLPNPPAQSPTDAHSSPALANASPSQVNLWRRRSLKSEKSLALPELKLVGSNGSTVVSAQALLSQEAISNLTSQPQPSRLQSQPESFAPRATTSRVPLPRSTNASLPGRNIRPVASLQQLDVREQENTMGQRSSSLAGKLQKKRSVRDLIREIEPQGSQASPSPTTANTNKSLPSGPGVPIVRLPTPEYGTNDVKSPIIETVVSPISPASSPELEGETKPVIQRKAVGGPEHQIRTVQSTPTLARKPSNSGLPVRSPMGLPTSPAATRDRTPSQGQFPSRTSSRRGDEQRPSAAANRRDPVTPPENLQVPKQRPGQFQAYSEGLRAISEAGSAESDETVRPRLGDASIDTAMSASPATEAEPEEPRTTDHPGAALFPRNWFNPLPSNEVMDARPLTDRQFKCITKHRYMTSNKQRFNAIACRTCGHKDRLAECFICSACSLNICGNCALSLRRFKGDLKQLLDHIEEGRTLRGNEDMEEKTLPSGEGDMAKPASVEQPASRVAVEAL
ncbi:hypothetical protein QBC46DRAFT_373878 [Diplogelasinospora grovesii]|uniref:Uncharacterized protein n=1 Tax=Diplogelasinospora grovesii TaxID=303347 RepID=A0AAN6S946_9PEZI|nr:hypothetical protein QBC46DRAFT_373878 [Diplogelasinospora grovesii]